MRFSGVENENEMEVGAQFWTNASFSYSSQAEGVNVMSDCYVGKLYVANTQ